MEAVVAWVAIGISLLALGLQLSQFRGQRKRQIRAQASLIAAWPELVDNDTRRCTVLVRNGSREPIYDCGVRLLNQQWQRDQRTVAERVIDLIKPESDAYDSTDWLGPMEPLADDGPSLPQIEIEFRDAEGQVWIRRANGILGPVAE